MRGGCPKGLKGPCGAIVGNKAFNLFGDPRRGAGRLRGARGDPLKGSKGALQARRGSSRYAQRNLAKPMTALRGAPQCRQKRRDRIHDDGGAPWGRKGALRQQLNVLRNVYIRSEQNTNHSHLISCRIKYLYTVKESASHQKKLNKS